MKTARHRIDVNLEELDRVLDDARQAPLSEADHDKLIPVEGESGSRGSGIVFLEEGCFAFCCLACRASPRNLQRGILLQPLKPRRHRLTYTAKMTWRILIPMLALATAGCGGTSTGGSTTSPIYPFAGANTLQSIHEFGTNTFVAASKQGDTIAGLSQDVSGNLLMAGYTAGNLSGYSGTVGMIKGTLYKIAPNGNQLWAKELTTGDGDGVDGVVVTTAGILVVGDTFGAYPGASNPLGIDEAFLAQFDTSGNLQWLKQYPSTVDVSPRALCTDSSGDLIFAGEISDSAGGGQDMFIEKADANGNEQWEKSYGTGAVDLMTGVTVDGSGDVYAVGITTGAFPGSQTTALGQPFVLKVDGGAGGTVWLQQFGDGTTPPSFYPSAIQAVAAGKLDVLGESVVQITNNVASNIQVEVMQMDAASGSALWNFQFGAGDLNIPGQSLAVDANGDIYVGGTTKGALVSGVTAGTQDIFLAKISSSGSGIWAQQIGTGADGPALESTASTPVYVSLGGQSIFLGGMTSGQFQGFSNPNQDIELFLANFGQ